MTGATVRDIVAVLDSAYPPRLAADWDAVGLTCGVLDSGVTSVLLAVDPVLTVVQEAIDLGAQMIVTHHPLLLRGVHSVAATNAKGVLLHTLITSGIALFSAHTNADHANPGVSDALAAALGIVDLEALAAVDGEAAGEGSGRIGTLAVPVTLAKFAEHVAMALPATHHGVRVAGDLQRLVRTVAVCGGAGDAFLTDAASRADVYVTADLRHHRAQDHRADGGCALIDVAHWASEWPWLEQAAGVLREGLRPDGGTVSIHVSSQPTDPWTAHLGSIN